MTVEDRELHEAKWRRVRRVKRWLRPLPRRANIHRYPVLSLFAEAAKNRMFLWSFRVENAVPAIYAGCILTLLPLFGVQLPLALLVALILRANLPILAGLQMISNPLTVLPIWYASYQIGRHFLSVLGVEAASLTHVEVQSLLDHFTHAQWGENLSRVLSVFGVTSLGSIIMGTFFGLIGAFCYRMIARRTTASYIILKDKIEHHRLHKIDPAFESKNDRRD